jgi:hypothetical protein
MPALPGPLRHAALPVLWAILPLTVGPALAAALADTSRPVQVTASVGAWAIWAATLVATLVPRALGLTAIRIVGPAVLAAALWTAVDGVDATEATVAAASAAVVTAVVLWPGTADRFVDGSSYGEERRFPLRPPGQLLLGPIELAWVVAVAGVITGPLLLAAGSTVVGGIALVVGLPAAAVTVRALHTLSLRWLVFVPAGVVVHDPLVLRDPSLLLRRQVTAVRPAPADTAATDLTADALGLALEIDLSEPVTIAPSGRFGLPAELRDVTTILVAPTRPGAVIRTASERHLPTG